MLKLRLFARHSNRGYSLDHNQEVAVNAFGSRTLSADTL
jgi:hypothetical protein